jgi:hypothetical protein
MKGLVVAGLLLAALSAARADEWYVNYQKAKEAVSAKQWQRAVDLLNEAIGDKDRSSSHVKTYGMQFIPYFPYIYRGVAYFNLQNKPAAKSDLEREENNDASGDDKNLLQQYLDLLQKQAAPPVIAEQKKPEPETTVKKEVKEQKEQKETEKKPAESKPGRSNVPLTESTTKARQQNVQQPPRETVPAASTTTTAVGPDTAGQSLLAAARISLEGGNYRLAKSQILAYRRGGGSSAETTRMLSSIGVIEEQVRKGALLYFEGKFDRAAVELSGASSKGRDNPHAFALLACAYAAQYLVGGSADGTLKNLAFEAYARTRQLDAAYVLNKEYISPQIIKLLSSQ